MKSTDDRVKEGTLKEVEDMLKSGMEQLSKQEFLDALDLLGYKMGPKYMEMRYINTLNEGKIWQEYNFDIVEIDTGISAFNVDARRDNNFKKLQEMRMNCFVFERGYIWCL